jgi:hypothetical protein
MGTVVKWQQYIQKEKLKEETNNLFEMTLTLTKK